MKPGINYCLITGASNGIGKALAEECTNRKMNLFLIDLPNTGLEEFAGLLATKNGNNVKCLSIDLTGFDAPKQVYDYAKTNSILVDLLINNAGVGGVGALVNQNPDEISTMIMLNIRATTLLTYYFLNDMRNLPTAHILNISSFAALAPVPYKCVYAATKSYILFFTRSLNFELKGTNVKVTSLHPTGVATNSRIKETLKKAGMMARISTLAPSSVAKYAIDGVLKGKKFITPGLATWLFYIIGSILPYGISTWLVGRVFRKH
jgi:uncharacterized protein